MPRIREIIPIAIGLSAIACSGDRATTAPPSPREPVLPSDFPRQGQLAFVGSASTGSAIVVMNADGSGSKQVAAGPADNPAWSPDGARLAFSGANGIYVVNADGTGLLQVTGAGDEPAWSPDGTRLAFSTFQVDSSTGNPTASRRIAVVNADGSGFAWNSNGPWDSSPAWSPDGRMLAFVHDWLDGDRPTSIYEALAGLPLSAAPIALLPPGLQCAASSPAWTPDGRSLLLWSACPGAPIDLDASLGFAIANSDGSGGMKPITSDVAETYDSRPAWSPDGKWIAFSSPGHDSEDGLLGSAPGIYVMHADGSTATRLAMGTKPAWRPSR